MECISEDLYNVLFVVYFKVEVLCYRLLLIYNMVLWCVIGTGLYNYCTAVCHWWWFISSGYRGVFLALFGTFLDINCQFLKLFRLAHDH